MTKAIHIFKKDVTHLWPQILAFVATLVLFACEDPIYVPHDNHGLTQLYGLIYPVLTVACWLLITSLMLEERAVGHDQYWLAHPFTLRDLLAAKVLFLLVFVILPVFLCQSAVLAANRLSPIEHFEALLAKQFFFAAIVWLPIVALASMTRNLGHAFLGGLLLVVVLSLVTGMMSRSGWGGLDWIPETAVAAVTFCGSLMVTFVQYRHRGMNLGLVILGCSTAAVFLILALPPLEPAFTITSWFSQQRIDPAAVQIVLDPRTENPPDSWRNPHAGDVYLEIPIRVANIPGDLDIWSEWVSVESPWRSAWSTNSFISPDERWLAVKSGSFHGDVARVRGSIDLTLMAPVDSGPYCVSTTSPWFGPLDKCNTVRRPAAHIRRTFDLGPLRLADYRVTVP